LYSLADEKEVSTLWGQYPSVVDFSDKVVLDPMMGGGTTVVEALRFGCKVIAGDLNPVAWFIVKKEIEDINPDLLRNALARLKSEMGSELSQYYRTTCPDCGGDAEGIYYFYYKKLTCSECAREIPLMRNFVLAKNPSKQGDFVICPRCWSVFHTENSRNEVNCSNCDHIFVPLETSLTNGREYHCSSKGCKSGKIIDYIRENGRAEEQMYAVEFHCRACEKGRNPRLKNGRGYKAPDSRDFELLRLAQMEFKRIEASLPIPDTQIPIGVETGRALNHGYLRFRDMFNGRQLLNLGKIYHWILKTEDWKLKEFLILAFSNSLKYNNMFAKYNATRGFITDIFRTHSFSPSMAPVEANCYDTPKGRGAFTAFLNLVVEGKEYCRSPFERLVEDNSTTKVQSGFPVAATLAPDYERLGDERRVLLQCGSSNHISVPDGVADAVITDPPYYGNVMYSELSNFFYVWLRLALHERYEHFKRELVPWEEEVIENRVQKKGEQEFLSGLTDVFSEANRVLKDDGVLVFTFHHKKEEAWAAILRAILDSGFYVTTIHPVRSEMKASTHLYDMSNIIYDMVIVCRKRVEGTTPTEWSSIRKTISRATRQTLDYLVKNGERPSSLDVFVMALGRCLEHYSKHYPNVVDEGKRVGVREALASIRHILDSEIQ
jgi:putative DNA methylase